MIKPAYSVSFVLSINIFVWQNVLYFPNDSSIFCFYREYHMPTFKGSLSEGRGGESLIVTFPYFIGTSTIRYETIIRSEHRRN